MALRELLLRLDIKVSKRGQQQSKEALKRTEKSLNRLKTLAAGLGTFFAGRAILRGFGTMITAASDTTEAMNKFGAVFTTASGDVEKSLDNISERTGVAKNALREYTSQIGAIARPTLGSAAAAGKMAAGVADLALDIASFNDIPLDVAVQKIQSGLVGMARPLDNVGVNLRKGNLENSKFVKGLGKTVKQLSAAELMTARYEAIAEQLGEQGAIGDATRTSRFFANRLRAVQTQFTELISLIGQKFLPLMLVLLNGLFSLIIAIKNNLTPVLIGVTAAIGGLTGALVIAGNASIIAARKMIIGWLAVAAPFLAIAALIGGLIFLVGILIEDVFVFATGGRSLIGQVIEQFHLLSQTVQDLIGIIADPLMAVFGLLGSLLATILSFITNIFTKGIRVAFMNLFEDLGESVLNFFNRFFNIFTRISRLVTTVVDEIKKKWAELVPSFSKGLNKVKGFFSAVGGALGIGVDENAAGEGVVSRQATAPTGGAGGNVSNAQQTNNVSVQVDASGAGTPEQVRPFVEQAVNKVLDRQNQMAARALVPATS